jgi:hypothetical protein
MAKVRKGKDSATVILVPVSEEYFFERLRLLVREELKLIERSNAGAGQLTVEGMNHVPLYDMNDVCALFRNVSRSTIYEWIDQGILKPKKMKGKVYFLWEDIRAHLQSLNDNPTKPSC